MRNEEEGILSKLSGESKVLQRRRNVRRQSVAIFNAFEDITNQNRGLLDEQELVVGDEDIVIPTGGKVTNLVLGSESSSLEAKMVPKHGSNLRNLSNLGPENQTHNLGRLKDRVPSEEDSLLLPSISSLDDDAWLLPVPEVQGKESPQIDNKTKGEGKERVSRGVYLRKPSRLQPPSTGRLRSRGQAAGSAMSSRMQQQQTKEHQSEKDSPFTKHLKFLEEHPEMAFSTSQNIPEDRPMTEIKSRKKTSLERHLELWGVSQLPSLDEKKL